MDDFGERLRRLRQQRSRSLRDLAREVCYDHSYLSQVERGVRAGTRELARACDSALDAGGVLVEEYDKVRAGEELDPMRRRTLLSGLAGIVAGATTPLGSLEAARAGLGVGLDAAGERTVADWHAVAVDYARGFYTTTPTVLVEELTADLVVLGHLLDAYRTTPAGQDLSAVAGQLAVVMAMSLASLGQARTARRWWGTARAAADRSCDIATRAWVRDWETVNGLYERRPLPELLDLAEETLALAGRLPCAGVAGVLSGKAQGLAVDGRAGEAVAALRQLAVLTEALPAQVTADEVSMHGWPEFRLRHTESWVYTHLHMTSEAYVAQDAALALYPAELAREQAQLRMHRAACLVQDGDLTGGLSYAHTALDELPAALHNEMLYATVRTVLAAVPIQERHRPAIGELDDRLALPAGGTP